MNTGAERQHLNREGVTRALRPLHDQWVEAINTTSGGAIASLITSRGWVIRGRIHAPGYGFVETDDSRLSGRFILDVTALPAGSLRIQGPQIPREKAVTFTVDPPWEVTGEMGFTVSAETGTDALLLPGGSATYATPALIEHLRERPITSLELDTLREGEIDWVAPWDVAGILTESGMPISHALVERSVDALAALVARGELGMGAIGDGFEPSTAGVEEDIELIARTWRALSPRTTIAGQIGWFNLTDAGRARLEASRSK